MYLAAAEVTRLKLKIKWSLLASAATVEIGSFLFRQIEPGLLTSRTSPCNRKLSL
jgi:hypothetical protein